MTINQKKQQLIQDAMLTAETMIESVEQDLQFLYTLDKVKSRKYIMLYEDEVKIQKQKLELLQTKSFDELIKIKSEGGLLFQEMATTFFEWMKNCKDKEDKTLHLKPTLDLTESPRLAAFLVGLERTNPQLARRIMANEKTGWEGIIQKLVGL